MLESARGGSCDVESGMGVDGSGTVWAGVSSDVAASVGTVAVVVRVMSCSKRLCVCLRQKLPLRHLNS